MKNILQLLSLVSTFSLYAQTTDSGGTYGIVNYQGDVLVPFEYDVINHRRNSMTRLPDGFFAASKNGEWGIIDTYGGLVIPFQYSELKDYTEEGLIIARRQGMEGVIDTAGTIKIPFQYTQISFLNRGLLEVKTPSGSSTILDTAGNVVYAKPFHLARRERSGRIWILEEESYHTSDGHSRYGAIDSQGAIKVPFTSLDWISDFSGGYAVVSVDDAFGVIDSLGNEVLPMVYSSYWDLTLDAPNGIVITNSGQGDEQKCMLFDLARKEMLPPVFEYIKSFRNGLLAVQKEGKYGIINTRGEVVLDFNYRDVAGIFSHGMLVMVDFAGKCGAIDRNGQVVTPFRFDHIGNFYQGYAVARLGDRYGIIDTSGQTVVPFEYAFLEVEQVGSHRAFFAAKLSAENGPCMGLIDSNQQQILSFAYDRIAVIDEDCIEVRLGNLFGVVDGTGKTVLPIEYERILYLEDCMILKKP